MQTLIRIEYQKTGIGPFRATDYYTKEDVLNDPRRTEGGYHTGYCKGRFEEEIDDRHCEMNTMAIDINFTGVDKSEYFCAYRNLDELKRWMENEWITDLVSLGFRVYMIEVSECKMVRDQAAFKLCHILSKKDISELFSN